MPTPAFDELPEEQLPFRNNSASRAGSIESGPATILLFPDPAYSLDNSGTPAISLDERIDMLQELYEFRNVNKVARFLQHHSASIEVLREAYSKIQEYFPHTPVILEVTDHSEMDIPEPFLAVRISPQVPPKEAVDRLERFDQEWWLLRPDKAHRQILVTIGF